MRELKAVVWMGSSRGDIRGFPQGVRREMGHGLYAAQQGETDSAAKSLTGFGGRHVMEIVADDATGTYRTVYATQFAGFVYVLHAFQKKSKKDSKTPAKDMNVIRLRLVAAGRHYKERQN